MRAPPSLLVLSMLIVGCARDGKQMQHPTHEARAAVLATVDGMFSAMAAKDAARVRAACLPEAVIVRVGSTPVEADAHAPGGGEAVEARQVSVAAFADGIAQAKVDLVERWISPPQVRVEGDLADVWGHYELLVDGDRHHCGVDAIHLVRLEAGWRIAAISYSETPAACLAR